MCPAALLSVPVRILMCRSVSGVICFFGTSFGATHVSRRRKHKTSVWDELPSLPADVGQKVPIVLWNLSGTNPTVSPTGDYAPKDYSFVAGSFRF